MKQKQAQPGWLAHLGHDLWSHKVLTLLLVMLLTISGVLVFNNTQEYLSEVPSQSFSNIEHTAVAVMRDAGATTIKNNNNCDRHSEEMLGPKYLHCTIELSAYIPYVNNEQALSVEQKFQASIFRHFTPSGITSNAKIFNVPLDSSFYFYVWDSDMSTRQNATFQFESGRYAQIDPVAHVGRKGNWIELSFYFSDRARDPAYQSDSSSL